MQHFILNLLSPHAVLMLFVVLFSISGYVWPGYQNRTNGGYAFPLLWFILACLALVAWVILVFFS